MNDALDFFKMRRCVEDLHPDPKFPGCVYSEMKMCLAPCFRGCTDDEYRTEVVRVEDFLQLARRIAEAAAGGGAR
jgi:excinuclease ABC subunit C